MIKENYLGVDVCCADMESVLEEVDNIIKNRVPSFVVAINPEKIMKAEKDEKLRNLLNSAAIQIPDGIGVVIASKLNGGNIKSRVTGIDLMHNVCKRAAQRGYKVFMLGAKPGVAEKAAEILRQKYVGINIVGTRDGYFQSDAEVIDHIKSAKPDVLFVAMGSPKQEYWITSNMDKLGVPFLMGVGGSFDVICGNIKRAPEWMCRWGLEWLYRLIKEPWRYKRMMVLPLFLLKIVVDRFKK
jgi:N-acetylglucosaminyldiphosphoundecaprenol N-acetyl-beta-D-mannosaminyltransferase